MVEGQKEWTDSAIVMGIKEKLQGKKDRYSTKALKDALIGIGLTGLSGFGIWKAMNYFHFSGQYEGAKREVECLEKYISAMEETYNNE